VAIDSGNDINYTYMQLERVSRNVAAEIQRLENEIAAWELQEYPQIYGAGQIDSLLEMGNGTDQIAFAKGVMSRRTMELLSEEISMMQSSPFHANALQSLYDAYYTGRNILATVARRYDDIFRAMGLDVASGVVAGDETWRQAMRRELRMFDEMGIKSFVDAGGNRWKLKTYAEMVSRTVPMHVLHVGKMNEFLEYGEDLVEVSILTPTDNSPCPLCIPWEGQVLSISGETEGYQSVADAEDAGLFHPRCCIRGTLVSSPSHIIAHDSRWYAGEIVTITVKTGETLTVTPNHPLLTPTGWKAAGEISIGDHLYHQEGADAGTPIEFFDLEIMKHGARVMETSVSPGDYHGDGGDGSGTSTVVYLPTLAQSARQASDDVQTVLDSAKGPVGIVEVVDVADGTHAGPVYNMQTTTGWYFANSIISKNCFHNFALYIPELDTKTGLHAARSEVEE
jgi:hypothetical protein